MPQPKLILLKQRLPEQAYISLLREHPSGMSVELQDWMGSDIDIVNAARVSLGKQSEYERWYYDLNAGVYSPTPVFYGNKPIAKYMPMLSVPDDGLLGYLMRERHGTPFEMVQFKFHVRAPIGVVWEWVRHRIACVSGDTQIAFVDPSGKVMTRSIKQLYELKYGETVNIMPTIKNGKTKRGTQATTKSILKVPGRRRVLPNCQERTLRVLDETAHTFTTGHMRHIWQAGLKGTYLLQTKKGKSIRATQEHRFYTPNGWKELQDIHKGDLVAVSGLVSLKGEPTVPKRLREGIGHWTSSLREKMIKDTDFCYMCAREFTRDELSLDHVIPVFENIKLALDVNNLQPACGSCHRRKSNEESSRTERKTGLGVVWDIVNVEPIFVGEEMTYDIEVEAPNHNYQANGFIVHNSYNVMSTRYVDWDKDYYTPEAEEWRTQVGKVGHYRFEELPYHSAADANRIYVEAMEQAFNYYGLLLETGLAREVARNVLPMGAMTEFIWSINARSLMNFLSLRNEEHALKEMQLCAAMVEDLISLIIPATLEKWNNQERVAP